MSVSLLNYDGLSFRQLPAALVDKIDFLMLHCIQDMHISSNNRRFHFKTILIVYV